MPQQLNNAENTKTNSQSLKADLQTLTKRQDFILASRGLKHSCDTMIVQTKNTIIVYFKWTNIAIVSDIEFQETHVAKVTDSKTIEFEFDHHLVVSDIFFIIVQVLLLDLLIAELQIAHLIVHVLRHVDQTIFFEFLFQV